MVQDIRFALRMMRSHPWFSAAIVATLALGIGVNTTIFTLVNAVLYKALPFPGGDRMVTLRGTEPREDNDSLGVSYPDFLDFKAQLRSFERFEAQQGTGLSLSERGSAPERYTAALVTPGYFDMLGVQPILGRAFAPTDFAADAPPVILIGNALWKSRFGSDRSIVGRTVRVGDTQRTIAGVMPEKFGFPNNQDIWAPLIPTADTAKRENRGLLITAVRKPGISMEEASRDAATVAARLAAEYPEINKDRSARVMTFHEFQNSGPIRVIFLLMLGAVGFVLLIACANVANMMLSRALNRTREISVRAAMGASRGRLIRQLLVESTILSVLGGAFGLLIANYGVVWFDKAVENVGKPNWIQFTPDYMVFVYFAALCLASGLLFGIAPALRASRVDLNDSLKEGSRGSEGAQRGWLSGALVVFQFTLAVVLLIGAGLFIRGILAQKAANDSLPIDRIMTAAIELPRDRYKDDASRLRFFDQLLERLKSSPGVERAAIAFSPPTNGGFDVTLQVEGQSELPVNQRHRGLQIAASPDYLSVIDRLPIAGRVFDDRDAQPDAAVITAGFAERYWPGQSPLGKRFRTYAQPQPPSAQNGEAKPGPWITVVGVVDDVVQRLRDENPAPVYFVPYRPGSSSFMTVMLRTSSNPASLTPVLRAEVQQLDADLPLTNVLTMAQRIENQTWYLRVFGSLFSVFAVIALAMASVGIYAVVAHATGRRTREIGVRMALGATAGSIQALVLSRGVKQLLAGLILGLGAAFALTRLMAPVLGEVSPRDPIVFGTVAVVLATVGLLGCWLPARRASRLHPTQALREG